MKSVILLAPATASRLAPPATIKDGLLWVISIIYAIRRQIGLQSAEPGITSRCIYAIGRRIGL